MVYNSCVYKRRDAEDNYPTTLVLTSSAHSAAARLDVHTDANFLPVGDGKMTSSIADVAGKF